MNGITDTCIYQEFSSVDWINIKTSNTYRDTSADEAFSLHSVEAAI